ncbi:unnamed protein product, partial [Nesidiocoris tenuis]
MDGSESSDFVSQRNDDEAQSVAGDGVVNELPIPVVMVRTSFLHYEKRYYELTRQPENQVLRQYIESGIRRLRQE